MRLLMCCPDHFDVTYEINAWMHVTQRPDPALARDQWQRLYDCLCALPGVSVELIDPQPGWPDMVFTANAGIVDVNRFIPSRFRHPQRQGESPYYRQWFAGHGFDVVALPHAAAGSFEGEGDMLIHGETMIAGYRQRSDVSVYCALGEMLGREVLPVELVDTRWYHLDTCFTSLGGDLLAYYPGAFDRYGRRVIESLPGEKIALSEHDALKFAANAVVAGKDIVLSAGCKRFEAGLRTHGLTPHPVDLSEFLKSGGAAKCLCLVLEPTPAYIGPTPA